MRNLRGRLVRETPRRVRCEGKTATGERCPAWTVYSCHECYESLCTPCLRAAGCLCTRRATGLLAAGGQR